MTGISNSGADAETLFCLYTGGHLSGVSDYDAEVAGIHVEIKWCGGGTLNQVRPARFNVLVVCTPDGWYVVPAWKVVEIASTCSRGQHTDDCWASIGFNLHKIKDFLVHDPDTNLRGAVVAAAAEDANFDPLRAVMTVHAGKAKAHVESTRQAVRAILYVHTTEE